LVAILAGAALRLPGSIAKGHRTRMIAIVGMGVCGFGFLAFATLFVIRRSSENEAEDHAPNELEER
jgi:hypothetical protein